MTWVAWRQSRLGIYAGLAILIALAALLVPTGLNNLSVFEDSGLKACLDLPSRPCADLPQRFMDRYQSWNNVLVWLNFMPMVTGLLLALPVILDFEQRTYRLAWTQSITRRRWITARVGVALLGVIALSAVLTALMTWWLAPQDRVRGPFEINFGIEGAVPVALTVFSLGLALAAGVLSRRIVPAMTVTLLGYIVTLFFVAVVLRPNYMEPVEHITGPSGAFAIPAASRAWVVDDSFVDAASGKPAQIPEECGGVGREPDFRCLESHGIMHRILFHPVERFWTFQAIESGIFLGAGAMLLGLTVRVVSRRTR